MTSTRTLVATSTQDGGQPTSGQRRLVAALAVTQTVGYGVLYYAFAVLLRPIAHDLAISNAAVTGALTVCVLTTAVAGVAVGRWLNCRGGRWLMTAGSVLGTAAVIGWSRVQTVGQLYAVFVAIGIASAMVLYEPAFAVVVRHVPASARASALLSITVVAGFASTIFFPLTGLLVEPLGWRSTLLVLAGLYAATAIPLHALFLPGTGLSSTALDPPGPAKATARHRRAWTDRGFWLLAAAFTAHTAAIAVVSVHLVTYLTRLGHPIGFAATIAGLLGVLSVTGRIVITTLRRWWSLAAITAVIFVVQATAIVLLPALGSSGVGAAACVIAFGFGFGVATIARPAMLAERYDVASYAGIAGTLALPVTIAKAIAPLAAAAAAASTGGYTPVIVATAGACMLAASSLRFAAKG